MQLFGSRVAMQHAVGATRRSVCHSVHPSSRPAARSRPSRTPTAAQAAQAESAVGEKAASKLFKRTRMQDLQRDAKNLFKLVDDTPEKVTTQSPDDTKRCIQYATWANSSYTHDTGSAISILLANSSIAETLLQDSVVILSGSSMLNERLFWKRTATDTQAVVGLQDDGEGGVQLVVAFRGSQTEADWITDFLIDLVPASKLVPSQTDPTMMIHAGFTQSANDFLTDKTTLLYGPRDATDAVRAAFKKMEEGKKLSEHEKALIAGMNKIKTLKDLGELLAKQAGKNISKVVICGHSLGGALATLTWFWCRKVGWPGLQVDYYSYGAPRVGNEQFAAAWNDALANADANTKAFRVMHRYDLIPAVPHADLPIPFPGNDATFSHYEHVNGGVLLLQPGTDPMPNDVGNPKSWPRRAKDPVNGYQAQLRRRPFNLDNLSMDDHTIAPDGQHPDNYISALNNTVENYSDKYEPLSG